VLVVNAGSSSLKFATVDPATGSRSISGLAERLGTAEAVVTLNRDGVPAVTSTLADGSHDEAVALVLDEVQRQPSHLSPVGVGHRVVHGGERFADSVLVTDDVLAGIEQYSPLAPLHNPPALLGISAVRARWPDLPQAVVFDTAFHQSMPPRAFRYAVPEDWYVDLGVRRYGFHGTSHRFVSAQAAELLGRPASELALVVAHLGNGCSATAVLDGRSVDTTMGLTPLEGLVMGTRSGDVDPGLFGYLASRRDMSSGDVLSVLNSRSGLLGLSGHSNDMRALQSRAQAGDDSALLAVEIFCYRLAKAVSSLVVALGRLDALVFTGGIGENDADVRERVVDALGFLGLRLDPEANGQHGRASSGRICMTTDGVPTALVVPTDEELSIARDTIRLIRSP
jgi:acetate kinase